MRVVVPAVVAHAVLIGFGLASAAFSQTTVEFGITAPGPGDNNLSGVYTDPYQGNVGATAANGSGTQVVPGTGTAILAFCDDFTDDVSPPQYWTAFQTDLSQLTDGPTVADANPYVYYGDYNGAATLTATQQTTDYIAVAILAVESLNNSGNATVQNQLSFALWDIFNPSVLSSDCNAYGCLDTSGTANLTAAQNDVASALTAAAAYSSGAAYEAAAGVNVEIYTPESGGAVDPYGDTSRPQEFITVSMPEPSMWAALGFDSAGIGFAAVVFWRRKLRNRS